MTNACLLATFQGRPFSIFRDVAGKKFTLSWNFYVLQNFLLDRAFKIWKLAWSKSFQAKYLVPSATLDGFTFLHFGFYSEDAPGRAGIVLKAQGMENNILSREPAHYNSSTTGLVLDITSKKHPFDIAIWQPHSIDSLGADYSIKISVSTA